MYICIYKKKIQPLVFLKQMWNQTDHQREVNSELKINFAREKCL